MSPTVILPPISAYAYFLPYNLVKDTVAQTWSFIASIENLLAEPIGTLDGMTVLGSKVAVTGGPWVTGGSGTASVANADGTGTFTGPDQPYWSYQQIVAPQQVSNYRTLTFNISKTVTSVRIELAIVTDFPAKQTTPPVPPDTIPAWVHADSNTGGPTQIFGSHFAKRVIRVRFQDSTSQAGRALAIALVGGTVIGGERWGNSGTGHYIIRIPDDGSGAQILNAVKILRALPQVALAAPEIYLEPMYRKPKDGGDWTQWALDPDSANTGKQRWPLEMIDAPMAWGCSTGSSTTTVGVIDHGFHNPSDLTPNLPGVSYALLGSGDTAQHGTLVSSVIAAAGNHGIGITGTMWTAALRIEDPTRDTSGTGPTQEGLTPTALARRIMRLAAGGVRVVNISLGLSYYDTLQANPLVLEYRPPGTKSDDSTWAISAALLLHDGILKARKNGNSGTLPLLVIAAGNFNQSGANGTTDAWWPGLPQLRDSLGDTVLVVGASTKQRTVAAFSGANATHQYVDIMAPGQDVYGLDRNGNVVKESGTSVATPYVTGVAGLLLAFNPTLGSNPPDRKRIILAGADSNHSATGAPRRVGNYRRLNAYEALREAARTPGAPLCGTDVWITGGTLFAGRGRSVEQLMSGLAMPAWSTTVMHGGHRIEYDGDDGLHILLYSQPYWQSGPVQSYPDSIPGGTACSAQLTSHNGDTTVELSSASGDELGGGVPQDSEKVFISLFDSYTQSSRDTAISYPIGIPGDSACTYVSGSNCISSYSFPRVHHHVQPSRYGWTSALGDRDGRLRGYVVE